MTEMSVARGTMRLRVLRLLRVVRDRLEAHPRPERQEQPDAGRQARPPDRSELEHVQRLELDAVGLAAAAAEHDEVEDREDDHLADQRGAEDLHRQLDVEVAEDADQHRREQRERDPRDLPAEPVVEVRGREVREAAEQRDLEQRVGERAGEAGRQPELAPEAVRDERVEAAGGADLLRHRDVPDREDREDDRREQERGRGVEAGAEARRERDVEQHRRDGRGARHRDEDHPPQPDRVGLQAIDARVAGVDRLDGALVADLDPGVRLGGGHAPLLLYAIPRGRSCPTTFEIQPPCAVASVAGGLHLHGGAHDRRRDGDDAPHDDARTVAAEQVVRALERAAVRIPRGARHREQRRAAAQPQQPRLGGARGDDLDALLRLARHQAVVRLEQLVQRAAERAVEQVGEALGREQRPLQRDRLAVGEPHADDLEHEGRARPARAPRRSRRRPRPSPSTAPARRTRSPGGAGRPAARRGW